jgi:hypothetical protein
VSPRNPERLHLLGTTDFPENDPIMASDRNFFEQYPQRKFRLRPAFNAEIDDLVQPGAVLLNGCCWWALVHCIAPGARFRFLFQAPHFFETETSEATARKVWRA